MFQQYYRPWGGTLTPPPPPPPHPYVLQVCRQREPLRHNFSFHQVPISPGWAEATWNEKFA